MNLNEATMSEADRLRFRLAVVNRVTELFRERLEGNGNRYHGCLVPNITSITDLMVLPWPQLVEECRKTPAIAPLPEAWEFFSRLA